MVLNQKFRSFYPSSNVLIFFLFYMQSNILDHVKTIFDSHYKKKKARIRWSVFFSTLFVLSTVYHATDHSFHVNSFLCFKILFFIISFSFYLYSCFSFSFPSFASSALLKRLMLPKISTLFIVPSPSHTFDFTFWLMTRKYYIQQFSLLYFFINPFTLYTLTLIHPTKI